MQCRLSVLFNVYICNYHDRNVLKLWPRCTYNLNSLLIWKRATLSATKISYKQNLQLFTIVVTIRITAMIIIDFFFPDESTRGHAHYVSGGSRPISVSTVQVPSPDNFGTRLEDFSSTNPQNLLHIILRNEIQPPPYTENDPLACPSSDRFFAAGLCSRVSPMVLPPAYSDVVKENEARGETSGQQRE